MDSEGKTVTTTVISDTIQDLFNKMQRNYILKNEDIVIKEKVSADEAKEIKEKLEAAGATVEVK